MLAPGFAGSVTVDTNAHEEVVVHVNDREFIADLMFMNQFAVCVCGEIKQWEYCFSKQP